MRLIPGMARDAPGVIGLLVPDRLVFNRAAPFVSRDALFLLTIGVVGCLGLPAPNRREPMETCKL